MFLEGSIEWWLKALAGVQPRWIQGDSKVGMESASLEKYIFNYRYRERLETDSVVGKLVEKKRLKNLATWNSIHAPDGNSARKTGSKKETTQGNQSFQKLIRFLYFLSLLIYLLLHIETNGNFKVTRGSAVLTFIKIRCFT